MGEYTKKQLTQEYIKKMKLYLPLIKLGAFNRFDIKNGKFVSKSKYSQFYSFIAIILATFTGYTLINETAIENHLLLTPEFITVIELLILNNVVVLNVNLFNKHSGAELLEHCIEMDLFLGVKKTKFMRDISTKDVLIWASCIISFEFVLFLVLIITFKPTFYIFVAGNIFFQLLFSLVFDQILHVVSCKFLCLRVHYLNVGLVKMANLNTEYLMDELLSYPFLWKKEYDKYVVLSRGDARHFTEVLGMIVAQVRRIEYSYRFMIFACMTSLVIGNFLAVQVIIIFIKDPDTHIIRTVPLTGWFFASWIIFIGITQQTDKLTAQIERTKLICTYILLKPNNPDDLFQLSRSILDTLSVNDYRITVYNLFYFNQSILRSVATSVFVYIMMQLQLAFPKRSSTNKLGA